MEVHFCACKFVCVKILFFPFPRWTHARTAHSLSAWIRILQTKRLQCFSPKAEKRNSVCTMFGKYHSKVEIYILHVWVQSNSWNTCFFNPRAHAEIDELTNMLVGWGMEGVKGLFMAASLKKFTVESNMLGFETGLTALCNTACFQS